jgi:hypothetical protein
MSVTAPTLATPIIDTAAKRVADATQHGCHFAEGTCEDCREAAIRVLRFAFPWTLEAVITMAEARHNSTHKYAKWTDYSDEWHREDEVHMLAAYRAQPIMKELYPERFLVTGDG